MSAACPHSSCELAWVEEDRQAECPCHGSRFAGDGTVLNGPAVTNVNTYPATVDPSGAIVINLFAGDGIFPAVSNNQLVFDLAKYPALRNAGGAVVGHPDGSPIAIVVTRPLSPPPSPPADGGLLAMSALCTHAACAVLPLSGPSGPVLQCPCHASQFLLDGSVSPASRGPAIDPLPTLPLAFRPGASPGTGTVTVQLFPTC
jgi:Rieske Fe-S protein